MFTTHIHQLKHAELFDNMSTQEILETLSHLSASLHIYRKDEIVCNQGETFFKLGILLEGKAQIRKTYMTNDSIEISTLTVSDSFGEDIVCAGCLIMPYSLQALQNCTLLLIDGSSILNVNKQSSAYMSKFLTNMLRLIAKRSISVSAQVDYRRITSLKKRVSVFLLQYYQETGQCLFTIPLSRHEMANYLSVTRPALSKVLAELKKDEIIDYYKDSFKIENIERLMKQ